MQSLIVSAIELNRTNNQQVVKVAGIVRRLNNWYKKLTDPEYRNKVIQLQLDSVGIKNDIDELEKHISNVNKSIKDSDVESYNFSVDRVREISGRLVKELDRYEQSASAADPDVKNQFVDKTPKAIPVSLDRVKNVHISNAVREAVWNLKTIKETLLRHNMPPAEVEELVNDTSKINEFYNALAQAVKEGEIVKSWESPKSKLDINRNGEMQYRIITKPFSIPGTSFIAQVTVEGTDLSARTVSPRPVFSVHRFNFFDARQKAASHLETAINQSMAKLLHKIEIGD